MRAPAWTPVIALLAVLPACPLDATQDFTVTYLVHDPVDEFEIVVDRGSIAASADSREVISLKRHTFGFTSDLGPADETIEGGVLRFEAHCIGSQHCSWDHLLELPRGIGFDIDMLESYMDFAGIDRDITAKFEFGRFAGARLASPHVSLEADRADITIEFAEIPESVTIDLGDGDVSLTLPAGSYRCDLTAAGKITMNDVTCDAAADAVLSIEVGAGDITLTTAS